LPIFAAHLRGMRKGEGGGKKKKKEKTWGTNANFIDLRIKVVAFHLRAGKLPSNCRARAPRGRKGKRKEKKNQFSFGHIGIESFSSSPTDSLKEGGPPKQARDEGKNKKKKKEREGG